MSYCIDTSALIEAWVRYYPPDVFPTLWDWFDELIDDGRLSSIEEVLHELEKKEDELHKWAKQRKELFVDFDEAILNRATIIINTFPTLTDPNRLRGTADPFVIAMAVERGLTVVTAERSKPTKPRIPDVCLSISIPCITLVELFRQENWTA